MTYTEKESLIYDIVEEGVMAEVYGIKMKADIMPALKKANEEMLLIEKKYIGDKEDKNRATYLQLMDPPYVDPELTEMIEQYFTKLRWYIYNVFGGVNPFYKPVSGVDIFKWYDFFLAMASTLYLLNRDFKYTTTSAKNLQKSIYTIREVIKPKINKLIMYLSTIVAKPILGKLLKMFEEEMYDLADWQEWWNGIEKYAAAEKKAQLAKDPMSLLRDETSFYYTSLA